MSTFQNDEYIILSPSTNGDKIIMRDFKDKTILFRVEHYIMIYKEFYRDGYDYTFDTIMSIITIEENNYIFHEYHGDLVHTHNPKFLKLSNSHTNYDEAEVTKISSLKEKSGSYNFINHLEHFHYISEIARIKPMIKILTKLLNNEHQIFEKRRKIEEKSYAKIMKTRDGIKKYIFSNVLSELVEKTHCVNCTKLEIDLSFSFQCDSH